MQVETAGLLAAGSGERFRQAGFERPKPLIPVAGMPLIGRMLSLLEASGIRVVYAVVREAFAEAVRHYVEGLSLRLTVHWVVRTTPGSFHSFFALHPFLRDHPRVLLTTVDTVADPVEFQAFLAASRTDDVPWDGLLACTAFVQDERPLWIQVDTGHRILEVASPPDRATCVTGGLYVFSSRIFQRMELARAQGIHRLRDFLRRLAEDGYRLQGFHFSRIIDVDDPTDLAEAESFLKGR
ncbi:MAG: NDP-sugar synthase [Acidobacteria bacterium]|nr:NDP-sugar synthase [Acidobacteriota bacterium]MDW7984222.1 NDP-sugar synthase [Acidobacteriota bacterium]